MKQEEEDLGVNILPPKQKIKTDYPCNVCLKVFVRSDSLKKHQKTHTGEKDFLCEVCYKAFSRQDKLKQHSRNGYIITWMLHQIFMFSNNEVGVSF